MTHLREISAVRLGLASPEMIREWSSGEVTKPETLNYRSLKPEKDGLFCERIFGPDRDWHCSCGKYTRRRDQGTICEVCQVEVTTARVRRYRMGHIELACPVSHIWYAKGMPSRIGLVLDLKPRQLQQILSYEKFIVVSVDDGARAEAITRLTQMVSVTRSAQAKGHSSLQEHECGNVCTILPDSSEEPRHSLERLAELEELQADLQKLEPRMILDVEDYRRLQATCENVFRAGIGGDVILEMLSSLDLDRIAAELRIELMSPEAAQRKQASKRLKVVEALRTSNQKPEWMMLTVLPVLPPDLRPVLSIGGTRLASADLNELYKRVILRNRRLKKMIAAGAPEIILWYEKRSLQAACNALLNNRKPKVTNTRGYPLKSLSDTISGKEGRLRRNLLGKRVDYSGRSVICVGPTTLRLHQCGIPKKIALELYKPFLIGKVLKYRYADSYPAAVRFVERSELGIWDLLAEAMREGPVLLNRAPTLHRLSIQAFEPVLVDGNAIQLHPLVCSVYNADFDGDQMAIHLPLSEEARREARELLLSTRNLLHPATGEPTPSISQDMVLGCFYLTQERPNKKGEGRIFSGPSEALLAYDYGYVDLQAPIIVRLGEAVSRFDLPAPVAPIQQATGVRMKTTVGRLILNGALPSGLRYQNYATKKEHLKALLAECFSRYGAARTAKLADDIKRIGFRYATKAGISFAMSDIQVPPDKAGILASADEKTAELGILFRDGLITDQERYQRTIDIWNEATDKVTKSVESILDPWGSVYTIAKSGATKAKFQQIRQLSGMRGLMSSPSGKIIETPVKGNFYEGLSVLEYFVSSSGARSSLMKRSLSTADSGYLTRRLVDVAQDVIVRAEDCGTTESLLITDEQSREMGLPDSSSRLVGRILAEPIPGHEHIPVGELLTIECVRELVDGQVAQVAVRSVINCHLRFGVCQKCYGHDPAQGTDALVQLGSAVGIIAGQSIGEPGTQLSMRAFHSGGIAGAQGDIAQGLPRVEEVFEARSPHNAAPLSEIEGVVQEPSDSSLEAPHNQKSAIITIQDEEGETKTYTLPPYRKPTAQPGQRVTIGMPLSEGDLNPQDVLRLQGLAALQRYLVLEVQRIYRSTGVYINDKHMEVIVRQMTRYVRVITAGDTLLLPDSLINKSEFAATNASILAQGGTPATVQVVLLGLTRATLATTSFLAAASFQETTRVLTDAALSAQTDYLLDLKENVILGRLIPAGTGFVQKQ